MNNNFVILIYVSVVFTCLLLGSCLLFKEEEQKSTVSSCIPESTTEHEWYYLESPTGRCYETTIRVNPHNTKGYGFFGMSEIPCDEVPKQTVESQNSEKNKK